MKKFFKLLSFSVCMSTTLTGSASLAGAGGHGGDTVKSSTEIVMTELLMTTPNHAMVRALEEIRIEMLQPEGGIFSITNPRLREIFSKMIGPKGDLEPIKKDIAATKIHLKQDGPFNLPNLPHLDFSKIFVLDEGGACLENGIPKPMSVAGLKLGADICVSVKELKNFPMTTFELSRHIESLYFHEFTHHFGYGEDDAKLVENFILKEFFGPMYPSTQTCKITVSLKDGSDNNYNQRIFIYPKDSGWSFGVAHGSTALLGEALSVEREEIVCVNCTAETRGQYSNWDTARTTTQNHIGDFSVSVNMNQSKLRFVMLDHSHLRRPIEVSWGALESPTYNDPWTRLSDSASLKIKGTLDGKSLETDVGGLSVSGSCFYKK